MSNSANENIRFRYLICVLGDFSASAIKVIGPLMKTHGAGGGVAPRLRSHKVVYRVVDIWEKNSTVELYYHNLQKLRQFIKYIYQP